MSDSVEMKKNCLSNRLNVLIIIYFYVMVRFFNTIKKQTNSFAIGTNFAFVNWGPLGA